MADMGEGYAALTGTGAERSCTSRLRGTCRPRSSHARWDSRPTCAIDDEAASVLAEAGPCAFAARHAVGTACMAR
jgi:hypothetical protein